MWVLLCTYSRGGQHYSVEFTTFDGATIAVAKVTSDQIRSLARNEIHHTRRLETTAH